MLKDKVTEYEEQVAELEDKLKNSTLNQGHKWATPTIPTMMKKQSTIDESEDKDFEIHLAMQKQESVVLDLEPEIEKKCQEIEDKGHTYNIITDVSQKTNEPYKDKEKLKKLFENANKVLFSSTTRQVKAGALLKRADGLNASK